MTKIDRQRLKMLAELGLTTRQISREFNCEPDTIRIYLKDDNLANPTKTKTRYRVIIAKRLVSLGFSHKQISGYFETSSYQGVKYLVEKDDVGNIPEELWETIEIATHHKSLPAGHYHLSSTGLVSNIDGVEYDDVPDLGSYSSLIGNLCFATALRRI